MKRFIRPALAILFLVVIGAYTFGVAPMMNKHKEVREMEIGDVDLSSLSDGVYTGSFSYGSFTYIAEVQIKSNNITGIEIIKNRDSSYAKMAEGVAERVMEAQSLQVEAVSGATTTSKALLKAIENALTK